MRLVEDDEHFLELARYLPLNPVRAELCRLPGDWLWSSYREIAGLRPAPWFLDARECLARLGSRDAFVAWLAQGIDEVVIDEHGFRRPPPLSVLLPDGSDEAISRAHGHGYSRSAIADHLGVSRREISRRLAAQIGV